MRSGGSEAEKKKVKRKTQRRVSFLSLEFGRRRAYRERKQIERRANAAGVWVREKNRTKAVNWTSYLLL